MPTLPAVPTITLPLHKQAKTALTDVAYVGVGAAVMTAQQVQSARKEVQDLLEDGFAKLINLNPSEVRSELREKVDISRDSVEKAIRERIESFAKAGREALGRESKPAPKTSAKPAASTKAAA